MNYSHVADGIVLLHVLYVGYVVVGQLVIVVAGTLRRQWGRNPWFRWSHLLAIGIVAFEEMMGWTCPLTTWERQFRDLAGQSWRAETFMARLGHELLFSKDVNYAWSPQTITAVNVAFAVVVLQAFLLYPPRWFRFGRTRTQPQPVAVPEATTTSTA